MERFLDMHMYITSALQKTDMKAVGLQLALDLLHKKVKKLKHQIYFYYFIIINCYIIVKIRSYTYQSLDC